MLLKKPIIRNIFHRKIKRVDQSGVNLKNDIAIIGMACRFPGAENYQLYWKNLVNGVNSIREITPDRWDVKQYYCPDIDEPNKSVSKWGGLLEDIAEFDANFFKISPREAQSMDPQQRILLQEVWHCLEDAGVLSGVLQNYKTAVYVGVMATDYQQSMATASEVGSYACLGNYEGILANRISYCFGLTGESKTLDTACSSSLVALHDARRSLVQGESDYALAAGVNIICHPLKYISFSKSRMLSSDGLCKTFDKDANGYVPGEGAGVLLLTTVERALTQGHRIHAILKGSAVNHSGNSQSITKPRVEAQREVIVAAQQAAGVTPEVITYLEAHGTGTSLGDPIEVESLTQAFHEGTDKTQYCAIGSVKTNIGHLEAAAGMAGVIKVVLMMQNQKIVPTLNIKTVNPLIDFSNSPFYLALKYEDWYVNDHGKRYAGVSSFGFGGVNSHVILEEYRMPSRDESMGKSDTGYPFLFSATTAESLRTLIRKWQQYVKTEEFTQQSLVDISYTLLHGRESLAYRQVLWASSSADLVSQLHEKVNCSQSAQVKKIILSLQSSLEIIPKEFTQLCKQYSLLQKHYNDCCAVLISLKLNKVVKQWLKHFPEEYRYLFTAVVLFCMGSFLLDLGLTPHIVHGEGIGYVISAAVNGYISLRDALELILNWNKRDTNNKLITFQAPRFPFNDNYLQQLVYPFTVNADMCMQLRMRLVVDEYLFNELKIKSKSLRAQFTFKHYLEEWDKSLQQVRGITLDALWNINEDHNSSANEMDILLLHIILLSSLKRLQYKWQLKDKSIQILPQFDILVKLLSYSQLTQEFLINWIVKNNHELNAELAGIIQSTKQVDVIRQFSTLFPTSMNAVISKLPANEWLKISPKPFLINKAEKHILRVDIGHKEIAVETEGSGIFINNNESFSKEILNLWSQDLIDNQLIKAFFNQGQIISLPLYPFDRKYFWWNSIINEEQKMISLDEGKQSYSSIDVDTQYLGDEVTLEIINENIALIKIVDTENHNLLTKHIMRGLQSRFKVINENPDIKVAIITGDKNIFCMGGDQHLLLTISTGQAKFTDVPFIYRGLLECKVPVIAAMQGHAQGGGFIFGLYADIIIFAEEATYSANFMKYGFTPGVGATFIIKEKLGPVATEMMFTAKLFTGEELKARTGGGFIFKKQDEVLKEAIQVALSMADKPVTALKVLKKQMASKILHELPAVLKAELEMHEQTFSGSEVAERIRIGFSSALNQKRVNTEYLSDNKLILKKTINHSLPDLLSGVNHLTKSETSIDSKNISKKLVSIVANVLHHSTNEVSTERNFVDLGIDSIGAVEIIRDVNNAFSISLESSNLYGHPNIDKLASYISEKLIQLHNLQMQLTKDIVPDKQTELTAVTYETDNVPSSLPISLKNESSNSKVILRPVEKEHPKSSSTIDKVYTPYLSLNKDNKPESTGIAIIGLSCRFPDANTVEEFWSNLQQAKSSICDVPKNRWDADAYYDSDPHAENKTYSRVGAFIKDVDQFDPLFFNISPKEAETIDPQQRLFLQEAWKALENAGYVDNQISELKCGVFVGATIGDYAELLGKSGLENSAHAFTGLSPAILASRISYFLNLKGPSLAIDTACSSSLVAIHLACESIHSGESDIALAGGVALMLTPQLHIRTAKAGMLSVTAACRTFDKDADGIVLGEGVGVLVLKPLSQALNDGNIIYGVIKASGMNQDGATNGITAPNPDAQTALQLTVYEKAKISPEDISYIEAHGTGTPLGDPVELTALTQAFKRYTDKIGYCAIGSVKTNIGHTTMAAGVASVIKTILCLQHKKLVPTLNFNQINEHVNFKGSPFYVNTELKEWEVATGMRRCAAINSFGFSGTNAHLVIEEAPTRKCKYHQTIKPYYLLTLSAKSEDSLQQKREELLSWLKSQYREGSSEISLEDISYTLNAGRSHFNFRCAFICSSIEELKEALASRQYLYRDAKNKSDVCYKQVLESTLEYLKNDNFQNLIKYKEKLETLARFYIKGFDINWQLLHQKELQKRIPMPTYSFSKNRYWIDKKYPKAIAQESRIKGKIHPFLHNNKSTLIDQSFSSIFTGEEFFLKDNQLNGQKVLPGAVYIEMAFAAIKQSIGDLAKDRQSIQLRNIAWDQLIVVGDNSIEVCIGLYPEKNGDISFNIYTDSKDVEKKLIVYSQGMAVISSNSEDEKPSLNLNRLRTKLSNDNFGPQYFYKAFKDMGIDYGPAYQVLEEVYVGNDEVLAKLRLPSDILDTKDQFTLHPSILDSALHVSIVFGQELQPNRYNLSKTSLYRALECIDIINDCTESMWAWVRFDNGNRTSDKVKRIDIDLCDDEGKVCVKMRGFSFQVLEAEIDTKQDSEESARLINMNPVLVSKSDGVIADVNEELTERDKKQISYMILKILAECLKVPKYSFDNDVPFSDYGLDSILGVSFVNQLNDSLGITLNTSIIFDYPTVDLLTGYVMDIYIKQIKVKETDSISITETYHNLEKGSVLGKAEILKRSQYQKFKSMKCIQQHSFLMPQKIINSLESSDIAVIGMSGQFPGAKDVSTFWQNLVLGEDVIHELPSRYLDQSQHFSANKQSGKTYCKWGGILEERDCFDPLFFNISPAEAESMTPHQRLILQESWKGLEDAGYNPKSLMGFQVGVFIGSEPTGYPSRTFTGSSEAIIASRLSYYLNLKGPAFIVNTGCSSSGVAIHLACESLRRNESKIALAGGIYAAMNPMMLIALSEIEMLSPSGQCHTFDESSDGIAISEGVGIVVLKRLKDAIVDKDPIYGVIKGSGVNQDGASNGITAPNGEAQEQLITSVYKQYQINPEEISYVEAHGTGTKLGDPVEVNALVKTFKKFTGNKGYCALGSAKANIGHTAAAAGVIGLIKILLSFRRHQLPGLLHFKKLNPLIELNDSAFYINTQLSEWKSMNGKPLMAALNSFGHSGTNVHLVVQEYIPIQEAHNEQIGNGDRFVLIPLSAKSKESLRTYAEKLSKFLESVPLNLPSHQEVNLTNLAYTLQVGREAMKERVIFLVNDISELIHQLKSYVQNKLIENCWEGQQLEKNKKEFSFFYSDDDVKEIVLKWIAKDKLKTIAESWVQGFDIDWALFYGEEKPYKISLPTYSFAKERYWLDANDLSKSIEKSKIRRYLYPLSQENTSNLSGPRFSSTFTGEEFFLKDHQINGQKVLPGAVHLEIAFEAIKKSIGELAKQKQSIQLKNMVWGQLIAVGDTSTKINIGLSPKENGDISFDIYTDKQNSEEESIVHSQGVAVISSLSAEQFLNLRGLQSRFSNDSVSPQDCYEGFKNRGIDYGPAYHALEKVYIGENEVLAKLRLPSVVLETNDQFTLHPSLIDAAIQASIILEEELQSNKLENSFSLASIPYALEHLEIINSCTKSMWAWVRFSNGNRTSNEVNNIDIDLCDEKGKVCVRMMGIEMRRLENLLQSSPKIGQNTPILDKNTLKELSCDQFAYVPKWEEKPALLPCKQNKSPEVVLIVYVDSSFQFEATILNHYRKIHPTATVIQICLGDKTQQISDNEWSCDVKDINGFELCLERYSLINVVYFISAFHEEMQSINWDNLIKYPQISEIQLLRLVKFLKKRNKIDTSIDCYILTLDNFQLPGTRVNPYGGGITGLAYSIAQGEHRFLVRNIDMSLKDLADLDKQNILLKMILNEDASGRGCVTKFDSGHRYQQSFLKLNWGELTNKTGLKNKGVYVLLGGSGAIGMIMTRYLMQNYHAKIVWIGRKSEMSSIIQEKLASCSEWGEAPLYIQADVTNFDSMKRAVDKIKMLHPQINGAIFSGMVFKENAVFQTTETEFHEIFDVKAKGSCIFYKVFEKEPLDFMCYFSSAQSFYFLSAKDSVGYASGITFSDAFVRSIEKVSSFPVGIINWGYWKSSVSETIFEKRLANKFGLISDHSGFQFFEKFTDLLQKGILTQILYLIASEPVQNIMDIAQNEEISFAENDSGFSIKLIKSDEEYNEK